MHLLWDVTFNKAGIGGTGASVHSVYYQNQCSNQHHFLKVHVTQPRQCGVVGVSRIPTIVNYQNPVTIPQSDDGVKLSS